MKIHNQISKGSAMSSFITMRHGTGKSGFGGEDREIGGVGGERGYKGRSYA